MTIESSYDLGSGNSKKSIWWGALECVCNGELDLETVYWYSITYLREELITFHSTKNVYSWLENVQAASKGEHACQK